jgi:steroid 5-alpha reductase family enzyme
MKTNIGKILLFLITTPTYLMVLDAAKPQKPFSSADLIYPIMLCACVCFEFYADQQQWGKSEITT